MEEPEYVSPSPSHFSTTTNTQPTASPAKKHGILTMQEWIDYELPPGEQDAVIGTPAGALIRPRTKNFIEAPEKSFKTTVTLRLMAGLSCGQTVFPEMHVPRARKVLYLHGELSNAEIAERTRAASAELSGPFTNLLQGRTSDGHLINQQGQDVLEEIVGEVQPDDLVLDPWQSFISGCDENSFKDMSTATNFCNYLIEAFGVTLWIPIHLGKIHKKGARGHSTIAGWRDTRISLLRDCSEGVRVTVEPRWAPSPRPFRLELRNGTVWPSKEWIFAGQTEKIRAFVEGCGGRVDKNVLMQHLGKNEETVRKAVERAEQQGAVRRDGDSVLLCSAKPQTDRIQ